MKKADINPSHKIIADHLRSSAFLIADGILPSNEGRGYVLRRIMRRAMLHVSKLNLPGLMMYKLVPSLISKMGQSHPELKTAADLISDTLKIEEERFLTTLNRGMEILEEELLKVKKSQKFSGETAFKLYDTYGFPLDLTENILKEKQITVDLEAFNQAMNVQKTRAKANWAGSGEAKDDNFYFELEAKYGKTKPLYHSGTLNPAKILAIIQDGKEVQKISNGAKKVAIMLDQTSFYASAGGQKGDDGNIILASDYKKNQSIEYNKLNNFLDITETKKFAKGLFLHLVSDIKGEFKVGDQIMALVNNRNRQFRAQNHSATHLLHYVLREILGNQITQKGSNVDSHYFTFDFNHAKSLTREQLDQIEDLVNFYIRQDTPVRTEELPIEQARKKGAVALFGEKYDDIVRVLFMGQKSKSENSGDLSIEFCGGTHVKRTGNIGVFKIISEKGIAAGIRRIEAKTGYFALEHIRLQERKLIALLDSLKIKQQFNDIAQLEGQFYGNKTGFDDLSYFVNEDTNLVTSAEESNVTAEIANEIYKLGEAKINEIKSKDKELEKLKKEKLSSGSNFNSKKIGDVKFTSHSFENIEAKDLRNLITDIKSKKDYQNNSVILFFATSQAKVAAALAVSPDLCVKFDASKLIKDAVVEIGGQGGGGKPDLAMGGGSNKAGIPQAISKISKILS